MQAANYARLNFDKEVKKKVKQISRSEYGRFTKYRQLMNSLSLSITRHSRDKELEADSIALLYYLNTSYDLQAPIRTLEILDSADVDLFTRNLDLKKHFDFAAYPFKDQWLSYNRSNTWYASQQAEDDDSLRTHPVVKKRIEALQRQLKTVMPAGRRAVNFNGDLTRRMATRSEFEMSATSFHFKRYGNALFRSLVLAGRYPRNAYLHAQISECFYELYKYQKDHELGKVLELPDPRYTENYDRFLTFIHTLRLTELASIAYHYPLTRTDTYGHDEYFLYAWWRSAQVEVSQTDFGEYFNKGDNVIKGESQGFATVTLDMTGKILSEKANSWSGDIARLVPAKNKEAYEERDIMFHEFIRTSDNQIFAVGEQYKRGGTPMAAKLNIYDMVILEFNPDYSIKKVHFFEKDKNSFSLGAVMIFSTKMLSYVAKAYGGFDFVFSQISPDKNKFVVSYINYDRERGEKAKNVLGSIIYTPEKTFAVDKLALNRKSSRYFVYRAKEGYVMVSEYFEKEKRLDSRLEKLNY